ncbi:MAG: hypothetical protein WC358_12345 [Ignavibacteria bacterium]|jgi:hypothetical protein
MNKEEDKIYYSYRDKKSEIQHCIVDKKNVPDLLYKSLSFMCEAMAKAKEIEDSEYILQYLKDKEK